MNMYTRLKQTVTDMGLDNASKLFVEAVREGKIKKDKLSLRGLAQGFLGDGWFQTLNQIKMGRTLESTDAVDASAFSNITGQLLMNEIKARYEAADFELSSLVRTVDNINGNLKENIVPWLGSIASDPYNIQSQEPYPRVKFGENYITEPAIAHRGFICEVSLAMIYSDLTGQVFEAAGQVGERLAVDKEERIARVVFGLDNNHVWNGVSYNTYYATGGPWVNQIDQNIVDWTNLNGIEQLFNNMKDPQSNKPIKVKPNAIVCMPGHYPTFKRILTATMVRSGAVPANADGQQTYAASPIELDYKLIKSIYAYDRLIASGVNAALATQYAVIADFGRAFAYRQAFPLMTVQLPPGNLLEFEQDVALAVRATEWGTAYVYDPRYAVRNIKS
jgi:hypothetical protein